MGWRSRTVVVILVLAVLGYALVSATGLTGAPDKQERENGKQWTTLSRGDVRIQVSATGKMSPIDEVTVGSQLSGQITQVLVDYNDQVSQGQLLAVLDDASYRARVAQSSAELKAAMASVAQQQVTIDTLKVQSRQAQLDLDRLVQLKARKLVSDDELDRARTSADAARLAVDGASAQLLVLEAGQERVQAELEQNRLDLARTEIRSPIDGVVINRQVEPGQTVAASLAAPELFLLARSLDAMEIEAYVDETDIGRVLVGQSVTFSVDAYSDESFSGEVVQIRKSPDTSSGVVNYVVMIRTANQDGRLLPGMTANLEIVVADRRDVLRVDNEALRLARTRSTHGSVGFAPLHARLAGLGVSRDQWQQLEQALANQRNGGRQGSGAKSSPFAAASMGPPRMFGSSGGDSRDPVDEALQKVLTASQWQSLQQRRQQGEKVAPLIVAKATGDEVVWVRIGSADEQYSELLDSELDGAKVLLREVDRP